MSMPTPLRPSTPWTATPPISRTGAAYYEQRRSASSPTAIPPPTPFTRPRSFRRSSSGPFWTGSLTIEYRKAGSAGSGRECCTWIIPTELSEQMMRRREQADPYPCRHPRAGRGLSARLPGKRRPSWWTGAAGSASDCDRDGRIRSIRRTSISEVLRACGGSAAVTKGRNGRSVPSRFGRTLWYVSVSLSRSSGNRRRSSARSVPPPQQQSTSNNDDDQPDAGAVVVVKAHLNLTSLVLHWLILCPTAPEGILSGLICAGENAIKKGTTIYGRPQKQRDHPAGTPTRCAASRLSASSARKCAGPVSGPSTAPVWCWPPACWRDWVGS